ncbi:MAG: PTS mannose transporter subunit IIA [Thiotrichaceae bacterium]|nr:PTS mannose transporter subunit IIA [Thiotrichaceae bacterium]
MSVGILLITHDDIGSSLLESLRRILGPTLPLQVKALPIRHDNDPLAFCYHAEIFCRYLNKGSGVLVLTDFFGATPCNIACSLLPHYPVRIISGVNLPMLMKIMNYSSSDLETLAKKAMSGGREGVLNINVLLGN